jgi:hypothetical protein
VGVGVAGVVLVVVGGGGVVVVCVVVDVGVVEVEVVCGCVVVGVVLVAVVVVSGPVPTDAPHCVLARAWTVWAPRLRSDTSVGLTEPGRFATWVSSCPIAFSALTQLPLDTSADAVLRSALSEFASLAESRPELPPQAAKNAAASPSTAARRARET